MNACLGFDTSCYTTSVALAFEQEADGFLEERKLLTVPVGDRGLRQSDALYQHIATLPALCETLCRRARCAMPDMVIQSIAASVTPRDAPDSYMPVFRAGEGFARAVAATMGVPFMATDHQAGHLQAARWGTSCPATHLALQLSGGTSELLCVEDRVVTRLSGTSDISAGQLIDRIGVALGLPFPAGSHLEKLYQRGSQVAQLTTTFRGLCPSFSGQEAQAMRMIQSGLSKEAVATAVFEGIARAVVRWLLLAKEQTHLSDALLCGGVASSTVLRERVCSRLSALDPGMHVHFGLPLLSSDNAVGVALIGLAPTPL